LTSVSETILITLALFKSGTFSKCSC